MDHAVALAVLSILTHAAAFFYGYTTHVMQVYAERNAEELKKLKAIKKDVDEVREDVESLRASFAKPLNIATED